MLKLWVCVRTIVLYAGFFEFLKLWSPETPLGGFQGAPISKIQKMLIGKVILKAHAKFHWNRSILRWLKVGGTEMSGGGGEEEEEEPILHSF